VDKLGKRKINKWSCLDPQLCSMLKAQMVTKKTQEQILIGCEARSEEILKEMMQVLTYAQRL